MKKLIAIIIMTLSFSSFGAIIECNIVSKQTNQITHSFKSEELVGYENILISVGNSQALEVGYIHTGYDGPVGFYGIIYGAQLNESKGHKKGEAFSLRTADYDGSIINCIGK